LSTRASYLELYETGELERRVQSLERLLEACTVCPLDCGNNRLKGELARCFSGAIPVVSSYTPHFGEELALKAGRLLRRPVLLVM
jgi:putative pyruvate formate lyase activating enzyme